MGIVSAFLMLIGVLAIVVMIGMIAPIITFLRKGDYKNLAVYAIALWVFFHSGSIFISIVALVVVIIVGWKSTK